MADDTGFVKPKPEAADTAVKYIGMFPKVWIPGWQPQWIEKNEIVEVPASLAASLCEQEGNWELVTETATELVTETATKKESPKKGSADDAPEEE